ncbi:hypothetical protein AN965_16915 [Alkalicoccobacillus plakortidis]|uniref:Uncharacterized protein n=1 Tax=Alkalicoccobacillus plakortidis TaxID=444060 RepID=A0A9D5HZK2_9BACI|nr:hypothetical protein AN965_16915 [Alkalicoccobacillus plakortidis]
MELEYEEILREFRPLIINSLCNTAPCYREDLEQEIKIKIYEKLHVINNLKAPGFYELLNQEERV